MCATQLERVLGGLLEELACDPRPEHQKDWVVKELEM